MGVRRRLRRLGRLEGKAEADFVAALGLPEIAQPWGGKRLLIWRTRRGSLPVVFDSQGRVVEVTKL